MVDKSIPLSDIEVFVEGCKRLSCCLSINVRGFVCGWMKLGSDHRRPASESNKAKRAGIICTTAEHSVLVVCNLQVFIRTWQREAQNMPPKLQNSKSVS